MEKILDWHQFFTQMHLVQNREKIYHSRIIDTIHIDAI